MTAEEFIKTRYPRVDIKTVKVTIRALEAYAKLKMIEENESMLDYAERHMDEMACMVLRDRIKELKG